VGADALSDTDRSYLRFEHTFTAVFLNQRRDETRSMDETLNLAWRSLAELPRRELTMLPAAQVAAHLGEDSHA
jgi:V/A-type H+-transporting ATPase subunit B